MNEQLEGEITELSHPIWDLKIDQVLFHKSPVGIFFYDRNLLIRKLNPQLSHISLASEDQLMNMDLHWIHDRSILPAIERALTGEEGFYEGYYQTTLSHRKLFFRLKTVPVRNSDSVIVGGMGIVEDLTREKMLMERLLVEKKRAESNQRKANGILTAIPVQMFVFDKIGDVIDFHAHSSEADFFPSEKYMHKNILEVFPEEPATIIMDNIRMTLETGEIHHFEYRFMVKGTQRYFEARMSPLSDSETLTIVSDVTLSKLKEQELILAKEKAEESDKLKTSFLANMSHEIRTPMNAIIGFSQLINVSDISNEERENYSSIIVRSGQQLLNIINDVLEISKIETGQLTFHYERVDLNEMLRDVYNVFRVAFFRHHCDFIGCSLIVRCKID